MNQRELGRKERATEEANRMCKRYDRECGEVVTYKLTPEQLEQIRDGTIDIRDLKLDKEAQP